MPKTFKFKPVGAFLYKIGLIDYWECPSGQLISEPYLTTTRWRHKIRKFFCCHRYESLYRVPRTYGAIRETSIPDMAGCVLAEEMICVNCSRIIERV